MKQAILSLLSLNMVYMCVYYIHIYYMCIYSIKWIGQKKVSEREIHDQINGKKLLKRGWFVFFLNCTVLVNFFNKHYLLFDNNFYLCPKCLEKDSLSQHCSSVQTHHDSDLSSVAAISVSCGQLSADSESISELRNKKIRANCS